MALTINYVPDQRAYLGQSMELTQFAVAPAASDYPTGGYVITAALARMKLITGGVILGQNAAAVTAGYLWLLKLVQTSPPVAGLAQIALQAFGVTTGTPGTLVEAAALTDFTGVVITLGIFGY